MNKDIPMPIVIAAVVIFLAVVVGGGIWKAVQPASQPPPATALNIAHGAPPAPAGMSGTSRSSN